MEMMYEGSWTVQQVNAQAKEPQITDAYSGSSAVHKPLRRFTMVFSGKEQKIILWSESE